MVVAGEVFRAQPQTTTPMTPLPRGASNRRSTEVPHALSSAELRPVDLGSFRFRDRADEQALSVSRSIWPGGRQRGAHHSAHCDAAAEARICRDPHSESRHAGSTGPPARHFSGSLNTMCRGRWLELARQQDVRPPGRTVEPNKAAEREGRDGSPDHPVDTRPRRRRTRSCPNRATGPAA
jgi:hypothetical protein